MLVVVTIIALFAALVGPRLFSNVDKAKRTQVRAQINSFMTALGSYKLDTGNFPTTRGTERAARQAGRRQPVGRAVPSAGHSAGPLGPSIPV